MKDKDKKRVDQDVRPIGPWFSNYDYGGPEEATETSPGRGLYNGDMGKHKSVRDFIEKKRKRRNKLKKATLNAEQLLKAATRFSHLAAQQVGESDSTIVTLAVRPVANKVLSDMKFDTLVQQTVQNLVNKNNDIRGDLKISSFVTNANLVNGRWVVNPSASGLKVEGSLASQPAIKSLISRVNQSLFRSLASELDRQTKGGSLVGNKITNHVTDISEVSINV